MSDFPTRVEGQRHYLLRYASLQLRDRQAAEDAVQDTLLAALAGEAGFGERLALRVHLAICKGCTNFSRQLAFLRKAVARIGDSSGS